MKLTSAAAAGKGMASAANANQVSQKRAGQAKSLQKAPKQGNDGTNAVSFKANPGLPAGLQRNMETALGQDFSGVRIQRDSAEATSMGALAFTKGEQVHFAPGHYNPGTTNGQNLIGHEFTHVAQQRSGVVQPTRMLGKGLAANDNKGLEAEADAFGKMATRGQHIAKYRAPQNSNSTGPTTVQAKKEVVQFVTAYTHYGEFNHYGSYKLRSAGTDRGCEIDLDFDANDRVDATQIAMVQTVQTIHNNRSYFINNDDTYAGRAIPNDKAGIHPVSGNSDEGAYIDQDKAARSPLYAVQNAGPNDEKLTDTGTNMGYGQHGWHYYRDPEDPTTLEAETATLKDRPAIVSADVSRNSAQIFETTALAIAGEQKGTYYGTIQWGWQTDAAGNHSLVPFKTISLGTPTASFMRAADAWNASTTLDDAARKTLYLPTKETAVIRNAAVNLKLFGGLPDFTLPVGTRVMITRHWEVPLRSGSIKVIDGPNIGLAGDVVAAEWGNIQQED